MLKARNEPRPKKSKAANRGATKRPKINWNAWRKKAIEQRGIAADKLPKRIKDSTKFIRALRRITEGVMGAGIVATSIGLIVAPRVAGAEIGIFIGGASAKLASTGRFRAEMKELENKINTSRNPRLVKLRTKYPFWLIDTQGNLIFTDKARLMKLLGRRRARTQTAQK